MDRNIYKLLRKARDKNDYQLGINLYNSLDNKINLNGNSYEILLSLVNNNYDFICESFLISLTDNLKLCDFHSESIYTLFIKLLTLRDRLDDSIIYLSKLKMSKFKLKRRTFLPIIESSYRLNRLDVMVTIVNDIISNKIYLNQEDYIKLLSHIVENKNLILFDTIKKFIKSYINVLILELVTIFKKRYYNSIVSETKISSHGECEICKGKLQYMCINTEISNSLLQELIVIVKKKANPKSLHKFILFTDWIKYQHYDTIIDGANVGYFNQRPDLGGKLSFKQIDSVLKNLLVAKKKPLIFLNIRHFDNISTHDSKIIDYWLSHKYLYKTHLGLNDDWFWLYHGIYISSKIPTLVITNDKMGDHHFNMLSQRDFNTWKEKIQTKFDFIYNNPIIMYPTKYSIEIQENQNALHIPYLDTKLKWLCIQL